MTTREGWTSVTLSATAAAFWAALLSCAAGATAAARVEVQPRPKERRVVVRVDGQPFTDYIWPERLRKPVLYPLRTAKGTIVTRGFPLEPRPGERVDHPHQVGLWFNYGDVNGVDFWNNSEALTAEEAARMGTIHHRAIVTSRSGAGRGELEVALDWAMPDGSTVIREETRFVFQADARRRGVDRITTLTARGKRVVFADSKEGLLGLRVTRALEEPSKEPEVFTDASGRATAVPVLDNTGVNGVYASSEGRRAGAVWGTRARWVSLSGRVAKEDVVLLFLDHPSNPGHPTYWHARGYGLFAANPLGQKVFSNGKEELNFRLEAGASAIFRHRLLILQGPLPAEDAEAAWTKFVKE